MNEEERYRDYENALKSLAELAAGQDRRMAALEALAADHQRLFVNHERRISGTEEVLRVVVELSRRHDEGMDELRAAQAETDHKLAALVDAQVQTEQALKRVAEAHERLAEAHGRLAEAHERLADSQTHTDRRLDALIDVVRDLLNGRRPGGGEADAG